MLFDTHAHMDDHAFDADRTELLSALPGQGVGLVLNPGCSLESSRNVDKLTREYDYIFGAVGSHPDVADEVNEAVLDKYRTLCKNNPKIKAIGELPSNFITKNEARDLGWEGGSVQKYKEGAAIGGDKFGNREGILPKASGRQYYECDIDTDGKSSRGAKRIVFSNDGLIYYTEDHYETFILLYGEE